MKTLEERTPEGLLELFSRAQISIWAETTMGWSEERKMKELKEKANEIRKEILSRMGS